MRLRLLPLACLLFACDDGGGGDGVLQLGSDAGAITDLGPALDAGSLDDAAPVADAALELDAAPAPDPDAAPVGGAIPPADPKPYSGGLCPDFVAGRNSFAAGGAQRTFDLYLPEVSEGAPLLFMWHPLGSNAGQIAGFLGAANAANDRGYVVAVPESQRTQAEWGYVGNAVPDLALFDDLLTCLSGQLGVDRSRVYTMGFSAGALWSSYLIVHRAEYLTAAVILSGGVNQFLPYRTPAYTLPVLLAWGGPNDQYGGIINFQETTYAFRDALRDDGHTVVMCGHQGGHVPPPGVAGWGYDFFELHDVRDGHSPIETDGLGAPFPEICSVAE